jgi:hypothetical protein
VHSGENRNEENSYVDRAGALIIAAIGGYLVYGRAAGTAEEVAADAELQTAVARLGELVISATRAGTVIVRFQHQPQQLFQRQEQLTQRA